MAVQMSCYNVAMTTHSNYFDSLRPSPPPTESAPWFSGKMDRMQAEQFLMEVCQISVIICTLVISVIVVIVVVCLTY